MTRRCPVESARHASAADADAVTNLLEEAVGAVRAVRGGGALATRDYPPDRIEDTRRRALDGAEDVAVVIGLIDESIVGVLLARITPDTSQSPIATIEALWVTPEGRGIGVGDAMLSECVTWAAAHGCVALDADALPGDRATKNFFEAHGLVARGIRVSRSLVP